MINKIIKVGIIGFGNIGKKRYLALLKIKKFKIKIIYIVDKKKPNINFKKIKFYSCWSKIKNKNSDLIIISTPTKKSEFIANQLSGKFNLLVEKPLSTEIKKIKQIISKNLHSKKIIKVGYNLRFDDGLMMAKKNYHAKKIGKTYYIKITYANGAAKTNTNKVGSLLDMGTHSVNILEWLIGNSKFKLISSLSQKNEFLNKSKIDNGFVMFKSKNIIILMHHGFCTWKNKFELEISGSKGFIKVNSLSKWGDQEVIVGARKYPDGIPTIKQWNYSKDNSWKNELEHVFNIICNRRKKINDTNKEAYNTLKIIKNLN
jgi:predicted dehydrogenase